LLAYQTFQVENMIDVIDNSIQSTKPDLLLLKEFAAINPIGMQKWTMHTIVIAIIVIEEIG
jgi:hypothetical protein